MVIHQSSTRRNPPRILIIGGGIAGLSTLISLRKGSPSASITMIDKRDYHLKIPRIHEGLRNPSPRIKIPFEEIQDTFGIHFMQSDTCLTEDAISIAQSSRQLIIGGKPIEFDYLVLAGGLSDPVGQANSDGCITLKDFVEQDPGLLLHRTTKTRQGRSHNVSIIGAGPTGVQFAFELRDYFERIGEDRSIHVMDSGKRPLANFDPRIGAYVLEQMRKRNITHHPSQKLVESKPGCLMLENPMGIRKEFKTDLAFRLTGTRPSKPFTVNLFGQVLLKGKPLTRIFAAGDLAYFKGPIPNPVSAQSAVRKGKLVARNILENEGRLTFKRPYLHSDKGYIVSLGQHDAVGWIGSKSRLVKGSVAVSLRELVDKQYDLFLKGIDTFIV